MSRSEPELIAARDLTLWSGDRLGLDADGYPQPGCVVVDLDGPMPDPSAVADRIAGSTCVFVGVSRRPLSTPAQLVARELACTLVPADGIVERECVPVSDPGREAGEVARAITEAPRAAISLAKLLRVTVDVPVADALAAESAVYSMLLAGGEFARWLARRPQPRLSDEADPAVRVARHGARIEVVIDRPQRHNAFDRRVRDGLVEAFDLVNADPSVTRVDLRGAGPSFCSGGDLTEFGTSSDVSLAHLIRMERSVAMRLHRCRDRAVAHLHGACIGAGTEIPSFAGSVHAREGTYLQLPELRMGLIPGAGGTVGVSRRIGRWRTAYIAFTGGPVDVVTALGWGLVDAVCDD